MPRVLAWSDADYSFDTAAPYTVNATGEFRGVVARLVTDSATANTGVTIGGVAATLIGSAVLVPGTFWLYVYVAALGTSVPAGSQTIDPGSGGTVLATASFPVTNLRGSDSVRTSWSSHALTGTSHSVQRATQPGDLLMIVVNTAAEPNGVTAPTDYVDTSQSGYLVVPATSNTTTAQWTTAADATGTSVYSFVLRCVQDYPLVENHDYAEGTGPTLTLSAFDCGTGDGRDLLLQVTCDAPTAPAVTVGGNSAGSPIYTGTLIGVPTYFYRITSPLTGARDIVATATGGLVYAITANLFRNLRASPFVSSTPDQDSGASNDIDRTIASLQFGDLGMVTVAHSGSPAFTPDAGVIELENRTSLGSYTYVQGYRWSTGASVDVNWTTTGGATWWRNWIALRGPDDPEETVTQVLRPDATVENTDWAANTTTAHGDTSDESDTSHIAATADGASVTLALGDPSPAFSSLTGAVLTIRARIAP